MRKHLEMLAECIGAPTKIHGLPGAVGRTVGYVSDTLRLNLFGPNRPLLYGGGLTMQCERLQKELGFQYMYDEDQTWQSLISARR